MLCSFLSSLLFAAGSYFTLDGAKPELSGHDTERMPIRSMTSYRLEFRARKAAGVKGKTLCAGLPGTSVDVELDTEWKSHSLIVTAPTFDEGVRVLPFRFGLWKVDGKVEVEDFSAKELKPVHALCDGAELGAGEWALGNRYQFNGYAGSHRRNSSRVLKSRNQGVGFNSDRYPIRKGGELVYEHDVGGRCFTSAVISVEAKYFTGGRIEVAASANGRDWTTLGAIGRDESAVKTVPSFIGNVPASLLPAERLHVRIVGGEGAAAQLSDYSFAGEFSGAPLFLRGDTDFDGKTPMPRLPEGYGDDIGEMLSVGDGRLGLWCMPGEIKVPLHRPLPKVMTDSLKLELAANECEAVQLVLAPKARMEGVRVRAEVSGLEVSLDRVGYVRIDRPIDDSAASGMYPDPLMPIANPLVLEAGCNCPIWIRVRAPKDASEGLRRGVVVVEGDDFRHEVPLEVNVFGFALPDVSTCKTMFGLYPDMIDRYHLPKSTEDRLRIYESYWRMMSSYRLSESSGCVLGCASWQPVWDGDMPQFAWEKWDACLERAFDVCHFNAVRIASGLGIGSGDAADHKVGEIGGVKEGDPRYEVRLGRLLSALQSHLEEKGWLDRVYVYCYDEPQEGAEGYVMDAFSKLERHAPKLRRLVTSPCKAKLVGGPHVWCPVAPQFGDELTASRKRAGDEFWMYVCTQPRSPYAGVFIEHSGIELRTWLWQCWNEDVKGILFWCSNYWNSRSRYPDASHLQNPYVDANAWDPLGNNWGGGEGRLFYPPQSAFVDGRQNPAVLKNETNFDAPVASVRAEMLRDGIEDYEYLAILKRLDANNGLLSVPKDVSRSLSDFSTNPTHLKAHRRKVAMAIERLLHLQHK